MRVKTVRDPHLERVRPRHRRGHIRAPPGSAKQPPASNHESRTRHNFRSLRNNHLTSRGIVIHGTFKLVVERAKRSSDSGAGVTRSSLLLLSLPVVGRPCCRDSSESKLSGGLGRGTVLIPTCE
jgi:hypothetical protein